MTNLKLLLSQGQWIACNKILTRKYNLECAAIIGLFCSYQEKYGEDWFYYTCERITDEIGISRKVATAAIHLLISEGVLSSKKQGLPCKTYYYINYEILLSLYEEKEKQVVPKEEHKLCPKGTTRSAQKAQLSIISKEYNNKDYNNKKEFSRTKQAIPAFYKEFEFFKDEFESIWFTEFLPMKRKKQASLTERALKTQLNKIQSYSDGSYDTALEILNNTVLAGWTDFYALKNDNKKQPPKKLGTRGSEEPNAHRPNYPKGIEI